LPLQKNNLGIWDIMVNKDVENYKNEEIQKIVKRKQREMEVRDVLD
jgi:hypothetical protein